MAMCDDYLFELISIDTCAPQFIAHKKLFLASVKCCNILGKVLRFIKIGSLVTFDTLVLSLCESFGVKQPQK